MNNVAVRPATYQTELRSPVADAQSLDESKFKPLVAKDQAVALEDMDSSIVSSSQLIAEKNASYMKPGSSVKSTYKETKGGSQAQRELTQESYQ